MHTHSKESLQNLTPDTAMQYLREGNDRFVRNLRANRDLLQQVNANREGQFPFATILSCMDSRTSVELVFDQGLGDIFSIRIAGNILNGDILGSMEFATGVVGSKVILVLGHSQCGAIKGACDNVELGNLTGLLSKVQPAIEQEKETTADRTSHNPAFVARVTELNVRHVMEQITAQSPIIQELAEKENIRIVGGVYSVETGVVTFLD